MKILQAHPLFPDQENTFCALFFPSHHLPNHYNRRLKQLVLKYTVLNLKLKYIKL